MNNVYSLYIKYPFDICLRERHKEVILLFKTELGIEARSLCGPQKSPQVLKFRCALYKLHKTAAKTHFLMVLVDYHIRYVKHGSIVSDRAAESYLFSVLIKYSEAQ